MGFRSLRSAVEVCKLSRRARLRDGLAEVRLILSAAEFQDCCRIERRWHTGDRSQSSSHHHHHMVGKEGEKVFKLGLAADVALSAGKSVAGYLSGSTAVIADAAHSISDIVLSGVALWSFRAARIPKDKEHPYGHGKFESLGALGISCMLLGTAGGIAWHAIHVLQDLYVSTTHVSQESLAHQHDSHVLSAHHHELDLTHPFLALNVTILSIFVKEGLYWITKRAGDRAGSELMKASAWHHRADAVSSVVALIGIGSAILGVKFLDPLAGVIVSGMILKAGLSSGYGSLMELLDAGVPHQILLPIKEKILCVEGVKGCHKLRGRRAGSSLYLDVHIEHWYQSHFGQMVIKVDLEQLTWKVDPFLSVSAAHDIGEKVRHEIHEFHEEVAEVFIHIDPSLFEFSDLKSNDQNSKDFHERDMEALVNSIFSSQYPKMSAEHMTWHSLQGRIFLQIEVSMSPEIMIREAIEMAKKAEKEVLRADVSLSQVSIQLRLTHEKQKIN